MSPGSDNTRQDAGGNITDANGQEFVGQYWAPRKGAARVREFVKPAS